MYLNGIYRKVGVPFLRVFLYRTYLRVSYVSCKILQKTYAALTDEVSQTLTTYCPFIKMAGLCQYPPSLTLISGQA